MSDEKRIRLNFTRRQPDEMANRAQAFYELMDQRRTVRDFSPEPIPPSVIDNALRTAGTAPSGANMQPWHFAVITDPATKQQIRAAAEEEERAFYERRASQEWLDALRPFGTDSQKPFLETAPCLIVIFTQPYRLDAAGEKIKHYYATESVGIATGMLISALHNAGLATLTHTPSPMNFLTQICQRPEYERPFVLLVTGYPATDATVPDIQRKNLPDFVSRF